MSASEPAFVVTGAPVPDDRPRAHDHQFGVADGAQLQNQAASDEWVMGFVTVGSCQLTEARAYMPEDIEWAREVLDDHVGEQVLAGPFPPSLSEDPQVVLAAYVPQPDGTLLQGIY